MSSAPRLQLHTYTPPLAPPPAGEDANWSAAHHRSASFPVKGQGTASVQTAEVGSALEIILSAFDEPSAGQCGLRLTSEFAQLWVEPKGKTGRIVLKSSANPAHVLDGPTKNQPYWLSFDANNQRLRYGKGEMMYVNMLFEFSWAAPTPVPVEFPSPTVLDELCKSLDRVDASGSDIAKVTCLRNGVNLDPAPHLIRPDKVTLEIIAKNLATVPTDLPVACQQLYNNVAGPHMTLQPEDFDEFPQAIQYSINTPGKICYNKLQQKEQEFGYLRVTLGPNANDSPGSAYVVEIWPAGNGSPIHDHGKACAVIKVLHGAIGVSWYSGLAAGLHEPWASTVVEKDEVTFLTPLYYQIHRLHNDHKTNFAATIQCYRYESGDHSHYEFFDYIDDKAQRIEHFKPDSDWDYLDFKELIRQEWNQAKADTAAGGTPLPTVPELVDLDGPSRKRQRVITNGHDSGAASVVAQEA